MWRAADLDGPDAARALYRDWADVYDSTIGRFGAYLAPERIAREVAARCDDRDALVVDFACGTGLVGQALARLGFRRVLGVDISAEMLAQAEAKGCYERLVEADLMQPFALDEGQVQVLTCAGGLTWSHLPPEAFERMLRLLAPGGLAVVDVEHHSFEDLDFAGQLARWQAAGLVAGVEMETAHAFEAPPEGEFPGHYVIARRG